MCVFIHTYMQTRPLHHRTAVPLPNALPGTEQEPRDAADLRAHVLKVPCAPK